jgi:hypothetical protein
MFQSTNEERQTMKFMMMGIADRDSSVCKDQEAGRPPDPNLMAALGKHVEELSKAGKLLATGGLLPISKGARVRAAGGKLTVTDGPFIESKEVIGGYGILDANSKEEAIELARAFMKIHLDVLGPSYEASLEIREMVGSPDGGSGDTMP